MKKLIKNILNVLLSRKNISLINSKENQIQKLLLGKQLSNQLRLLEIQNLEQTEFSVFSQWGDDGIIQFIIQQFGNEIPKTFIEFGVENYTEANTRFLLFNNNWTGLVMDGSPENIAHIKNDYEVSIMRGLSAKCAFINAENINELIAESGFKGEIGILHVDIDGNDYWVWKAINQVKPWVVIMEYNALFGPHRSITVPYDPKFYRTEKHHSNLYFGASLSALCDLAKEKGYLFIGSNSHANNAYFIHEKYCPETLKKFVTTPQEAHRWPTFKEDRDQNGKLTASTPRKAFKQLKNMTVWNVKDQKSEIL